MGKNQSGGAADESLKIETKQLLYGVVGCLISSSLLCTVKFNFISCERKWFILLFEKLASPKLIHSFTALFVHTSTKYFSGARILYYHAF